MKHDAKAFPVLDLESLLSLAKASKTQDIRRILHSPRSEDWVTWNTTRLLQRRHPASWWPDLARLALARAAVPDPSLPRRSIRAVDPWRLVPSPRQYESASRSRMAASNNPAWRDRAANPKPVEGPTEVDWVLEGEDFPVFIEAKLHSDVSTHTTYDPTRNQIVRNIDCVVEEARNLQPCFWMVVRDRSPEHEYMQLVDRYREDRRELAAALPHRDPAVLSAMVDGMAIIEWRELLPLLPSAPDLRRVVAELRRRVA